MFTGNFVRKPQHLLSFTDNFPGKSILKAGVARVLFGVILILTGTLFSNLLAQEETVESLQAKLGSLEKQMMAVIKDRDALYDQLVVAIDDIEALESKLADTDTGRNHIRSQFLDLSNEHDLLKSKNTEHESSVEQMKALAADNEVESQRLVETSLAQIKSALSERDMALQQLADAQQQTDSNREAQEQDMQHLAETSFAQIQNALKQRDEAAGKLEVAEKTISDLEEKLASRSQTSTNVETTNVTSTTSVNWSKKLSESLTTQYRGLANVEVTKLDGNRVSIRIGNAGLFGSGASGLSRNGRNLLSRIGDALVAQTDAKILVIGHTDNVPVGANSSYIDNTDLSNRRARKALQHLGAVVGIPFERLASTGVADTLPIASNGTAEGRALNRRIELELTQVK